MNKKNIEITIPTELSDITLGQHQELISISKEVLDEKIISIKMISILCGIKEEDVRGLSMDDFGYINSTLVNVLNKQSKFVDRFTLDGIEYGFIPNLDEITLGEYIDLDTFIKEYDDMHKIMTILYRPIIAKSFGMYEIAKYTGNEDSNIMKKCPLDASNGAMVFFYRLGKELLIAMESYLKREMKVMETQTSQSKKTSEENGDGIHQSMVLQMENLRNLMKQLNTTYIKLSLF